MPIDYQIDKARKLIVSTAKGRLTGEELLNSQLAARDDPDYDVSFWHLHDLREADVAKVLPDCIRSLAKNAAIRSGIRSAIVVRGQLAYGLARMFGTLRESSEEQVRVFRDLDSARTWLKRVPEEAKRQLVGHTADRRIAPRKAVSFSARLQSGTEERLAQVVNISISGALFECPLIYPVPGALIRIQLRPPEVDPPIEVKGRIMRRTETGLVVQFVTVTEELIELLEGSGS